mmetsp:Transcript_26546/g.84194  ORF Transcript_26546/g.84194 Transcript_26546/m.84194 type:complete len:318 (-) Transcript_26546:385-1338(-)
MLPLKKLHERFASSSTSSGAAPPSLAGQKATSQPARGTLGISTSCARSQSAAAAVAPGSRWPFRALPVSGCASREPSAVLRGAPRDFQPRAYQCAELEPVPRTSLLCDSGTLTMTLLWSVAAPARPARQTVQSALALVAWPSLPAPRSFSAPREPVTTRSVESGAFSGSSCFTALQLSSLSCRIQRPPCITFLSTWMPMPPSSSTSLATSVTGWSITGVTAMSFFWQAWMKRHLSSSSKSALLVASAVMEARRQLRRQSWNQSVGASRDLRKHSAAEASRPWYLRHREPTSAAQGISTAMAKTALARERAQSDSGTP